MSKDVVVGGGLEAPLREASSRRAEVINQSTVVSYKVY